MLAGDIEARLVQAGQMTLIESSVGIIMPFIMLSGIITFIASIMFVMNMFKIIK
jgi:hypothetical protein